MKAREKVTAFLNRHELTADAVDGEALLSEFDREMEAGLAGEESSLKMIPTFVSIDATVPSEQRVIVIDAGGTNLRVGTVVFSSDGQATIERFTKHRMPGLEKEVSTDEFFDQFVAHIMPVIGASDRIGFCFSYPAEISPERDGRLLHWTKEIKAPGIEGAFVGAGILNRLRERGHEKRLTLLNDTVATLLAGRSVGIERRYETYVGFILGTGTNTAYMEANRNITKRSDLDGDGHQAINVESGNFARCPRSDIDDAFDAAMANPGQQLFEKMISGAYLGGLSLVALKAAAAEGLFAESATAAIEAMTDLTTKEMDDFVMHPFRESPFSSPAFADVDKETACHLFRAIVERSALLAAVNISAAVLRSNGGSNPLHPVCVNVDGSTFYKTYRFESLAQEHLRKLLGSRGVFYELIHVDEAPLIGAAIAGLTH